MCVDNRNAIVYTIVVRIKDTNLHTLNAVKEEKMDFYSVRDLRSSSKNVWNSLSGDGKVVITNNGKPSALMVDISKGDFEEVLYAYNQAKATIAFTNMRKRAAEAGYMSDEEINAEIAAARAERKQ